MSLSYFIAALRCPVCGNVSPADTSTRMQTYLANEPHELFAVGDRPDLTMGSFEQSYLTARMPEGDRFSVLQRWHCPHCHSANWAEVKLDDWTISTIEDVKLTRAALDRMSFIDDEVHEAYEAATGESMFIEGGRRPDYLARLRAHLPES
jgi:hypothetical protein